MSAEAAVVMARFRDEELARAVDDAPPNAVILNVYDITWANGILWPLGLGIHHSGVEIYGQEIAFGRCPSGTGVFSSVPKRCMPHVFRASYVLGWTLLSQAEVADVVREVAAEWAGNSYHLGRRNCNVFAGYFAGLLLERDGTGLQNTENDRLSSDRVYGGQKDPLSSTIPAYVNRVGTLACTWTPALMDKLDAADARSQYPV